MLGYKVNFYYLTCIASTAGAKLDLTNRVCQHFQSPTMQFLKDIKLISHYLKGTLDHGL